jgi:sulfur-oxidizing protein SoxX
MKTIQRLSLLSALFTALPAAAADMDAAIRASFRAEGIVTLDSIKQDETQALCSDPKLATGKAGEAKRKAIEQANLATIQPPADKTYLPRVMAARLTGFKSSGSDDLGDWKEGEKIAQSGRGSTWTDKAGAPNGGGCYNCHQISKAEISHGTIGPTLYNYGKLRGNTQAVVDYTWGKLSNAKAYNACSAMPRIGHFKLLTEKQMRDVMALLLDPDSPVNK